MAYPQFDVPVPADCTFVDIYGDPNVRESVYDECVFYHVGADTEGYMVETDTGEILPHADVFAIIRGEWPLVK